MNPISTTTPANVGAGLARDGGGEFNTVIAGKPAPTQSRSHFASASCALALAISLAGCAGLPDQRLANEALKRGDTVTAQQNYQQLADLGYSEAQVGLADIQVGTRDPAQIKQAEATYRAAADTSPRAQARLGRLLVAKPDSTEAEHREAEGLLKKAFANGEGNTLIPLAMLYLQYPHSFPNGGLWFPCGHGCETELPGHRRRLRHR